MADVLVSAAVCRLYVKIEGGDSGLLSLRFSGARAEAANASVSAHLLSETILLLRCAPTYMLLTRVSSQRYIGNNNYYNTIDKK